MTLYQIPISKMSNEMPDVGIWHVVVTGLFGVITGFFSKLPEIWQCKNCKEEITKLKGEVKDLQVFQKKYEELLNTIEFADRIAGKDNPVLKIIKESKNEV